MATTARFGLLLLLLYDVVAGFRLGEATTRSPSRVRDFETGQGLAITPPRGWNSYNSFSWVLTEDEFLANCEIVSRKLLPYGYEYVVVDWLWYRQLKPGSHVKSLGFDVIDEWGRPIPDPERWPSSRNGQGFRPIADRVHSMGLKLGLHIMHGIIAAAVDQNTPIYGAKGSPDGDGGRPWTARDIAVEKDQCRWMIKCFLGVNTSTEGGRAYINSLYQQFASWGVDLVKQDCVFGGPDLRLDEVAAADEAIKATGRPMLFSISPGKSVTMKEASLVQNMSHTFRVSNDVWDKWSHLRHHFDLAREFTSLIGGAGLHGGRSWPDLDAMPLGYLSKPSAPVGPFRWCSLTRDEQRMLITLWTMARSPLMFGGDLRRLDEWMYDLITHRLVLEINDHSSSNLELVRSAESGTSASELDDIRVWAARGSAGLFYIAFFNLRSFSASISTELKDMMEQVRAGAPNSEWKCSVMDGWTSKVLGDLTDSITVVLPGHRSALYAMKCHEHTLSAQARSRVSRATVMLLVVCSAASLVLVSLVLALILSVREVAQQVEQSGECWRYSSRRQNGDVTQSML